MQDQASQLNQLGVSAVCLNSALGLDEYEMNLLEIQSGKVKLLEIRRKLKGVVTIALTATATARVREDIREQLAITAGNEFIASFDRPSAFRRRSPVHPLLGRDIC